MREQGANPATLLLNALSDGLPIADILTIASGIVGNPVLFDDVTDRIKAVSKDTDLEQFYKQPMNPGKSEKFVPASMIQRGRRDKLTDRLRDSPDPIKTYDPVFDCEWIFAYVVVNGTIVGNVLTRSIRRELTEDDRLVMGTLAWVVSLYLQCQGENEELPMAEMYFLYNLLNRNEVSEHNLPKWLIHMEWRPGDEMRVAVIQSRSSQFEDVEWGYFIEMLMRYHPDSILCTYENSAVLLQSHGGSTLSPEERDNYEYVLYSSDLVAGYSRTINSLNDVYKAYRQACNAIRYGMKRGGESALFQYEDYVLDQMVELCSRDKETLYSLCHPAIFRLIRYDKEHGTEFYRTLDTFFQLGNNLAKLSEKMNIHRNTAYYRMSKIYQITGVDLRGDSSVLRLQFSFALLRGRDIADSYLFT